MNTVRVVFLSMLIPLSLFKEVCAASKEVMGTIDSIKHTAFADKNGKCSIFSYKGDNAQIDIHEYAGEVIFKPNDFNQWKEICVQAAQQWIFQGTADAQEKKEYEICRDTTSALTLALVIINQKFGNPTDFATNASAIRRSLDPVIEAAKRIKQSFFKKIGSTFAKETPGQSIIKAIKEVLNKRVKEVIDDFNSKLGKLKIKDVKKLSL